MNLYDAAGIRRWDAFTLSQQGLSPGQLMERAAAAFARRFTELYPARPDMPGCILCGEGNNGGDALIIARILFHAAYEFELWVIRGRTLSAEREQALEVLRSYSSIRIHELCEGDPIPTLQGAWIIDGLFGSGLNRQPAGLYAGLIRQVNQSGIPVLSIDLPSGLPAEGICRHECVRAQYTLSFQVPKLSMLMPEHAAFIGKWEILDIGLDPAFAATYPSLYQWIDQELAKSLFKPRKPFAHKGDFGHALLVGGSKGKTGAILLAAKAAARSGSGLLSILTPESGRLIVQSALPEAMWLENGNTDILSQVPQLPQKFTIGLGPGMGTAAESAVFFRQMLEASQGPLVLDADGLNLLAQNPDYWQSIPTGSILTPHPREFERLFGKSADTWASLQKMVEVCSQKQIFLLLKGHHSILCSPQGQIYFNSSGNPGMATGGSGDVLSGILTALLAQGYTSVEAAVMGVWIHGRAGDLAAAAWSQSSMIASDIIAQLPAVFLDLENQA